MPEIADTVREIDCRLPELARQVIRTHLDLSVPENQAFLRDPDGREHHQTQWHQWGIITHTRVFLSDFETVVPGYLECWGVEEQVAEALAKPVDEVRRRHLLPVAILLHDIGKFAARTRDRERYHFWRHERLSREIILRELDLQRHGLTSAQVRYIAEAAGDHFVLGVVRKEARERGAYDLAFVESDRFREISLDIREEHPEDFVEIGVLFLGDSLSKLHPPEGPHLAMTQYDINIAVARRYLEIVLAP